MELDIQKIKIVIDNSSPHLLSFYPDQLSFEELGDVDEEGSEEGGSNEDGEVEERGVARQPHVVLKRVPDMMIVEGGGDDGDAHGGDDDDDEASGMIIYKMT